MTDDRPFDGTRILIVEDDYYLASDACRILEEAGAIVIGPFGQRDEALKALDARNIDAAVVDINLGLGPEFTVAAALEEHGVPFVFATGYGQRVIPHELKQVPRLEKPFRPAELVNVLVDVLS